MSSRSQEFLSQYLSANAVTAMFQSFEWDTSVAARN
jgi:hypothetical protein